MASTPERKKRVRGRPPTGIGKPVGLRLYPDLEQRIDSWAAKQRDHPGRPEAIRRLVEQALAKASSARRKGAAYAEKAATDYMDRALKGSGQSDAVKTDRKRRLTKLPAELARGK